METLIVPLADRSYPIEIGCGLLPDLGNRLRSVQFPEKVAVITNTTVDGYYGNATVNTLESAGFEVSLCLLPDGEEYKDATHLEKIYDKLISEGLDRGSGLIALGGGVIGDMAGYAAATFLRGIPYVQIPTTVLSQVDSSVGGKTAINHRLGKNLIGAFYQPELVLIDIDTLSTLEPREVSAGLAEVIKYGVIHDADFFKWLEENSDQLKDRNPDSLIYAIRKSCEIKADIVGQDEKEGSVRAYLNFGHTFGHAIEHLSGYGQWKHGEAVAVGMLVATRISMMMGLSCQDDYNRLYDLITRLELPVVPPEFSLDAYVDSMKRDKKVKQGTLTLVLNNGIGNVSLHKIDDIKAVFTNALGHMRSA